MNPVHHVVEDGIIEMKLCVPEDIGEHRDDILVFGYSELVTDRLIFLTFRKVPDPVLFGVLTRLQIVNRLRPFRFVSAVASSSRVGITL